MCSVDDEIGSEQCRSGTDNFAGEPGPFLRPLLFANESKWEKYVNEIRHRWQEEEEKEECWSDGVCGCYDKVMQNDLKVWRDRGGVRWEEFEAAKQHGVHYQIVNHTLRRQQDCLFSAR